MVYRDITPNELYTLVRWIANPSIYSPSLISHVELLTRAIRLGCISDSDLYLIVNAL